MHRMAAKVAIKQSSVTNKLNATIETVKSLLRKMLKNIIERDNAILIKGYVKRVNFVCTSKTFMTLPPKKCQIQAYLTIRLLKDQECVRIERSGNPRNRASTALPNSSLSNCFPLL